MGGYKTNSLRAQRWTALMGLLMLGLTLLAQPAAAAPFAYVANQGNNTVSVIDTATNIIGTYQVDVPCR